MPDPSTERRRSAIEIMRAEATRLMEVAQHDSVKELLRLAAGDLDEAEKFLARAARPPERVWAHAMADLQMDFAKWRLDTAKTTLERGGPAAKLFEA